MTTYVTIQAVLQEAGLWQRELGDTPVGAIDASNKVFTVIRKPLADTNYDDEVDLEDVVVYVNGASVSVVAADETSGQITLAAAPAVGTTVTVDYSFSAITSDDVAGVIEEAQEYIDDEMSQIVTTPYTGSVPKSVRRIARYYAAGLLMTRDYALQGLTAEETKEGNAKIKMAETWLAAYRQRIMDNGSDVGPIAVPRSSPDRRPFQRFDTSTNEWSALTDESFTINEAD